MTRKGLPINRCFLPSLALLLCVRITCVQPKERPKLTDAKLLTAEAERAVQLHHCRRV